MSLTPGVDSYATLAEALDVASRPGAENLAFTNLDEEVQEAALYFAARSINALPFPGTRIVSTQLMALPRAGLAVPAEEQMTIAIQVQIDYAIVLAPSYVGNLSVLSPTSGNASNVKRLKKVTGPLETETEYFSNHATQPGSLDRFPANIRDALAQLMVPATTAARNYGQGATRRRS